jgi:hypothetical protein
MRESDLLSQGSPERIEGTLIESNKSVKPFQIPFALSLSKGKRDLERLTQKGECVVVRSC